MGEGERNYHAFYHLVAGGSPDAEALGLAKGPRGFFYLNQSSVDTVAALPDARMYRELAAALGTCGMPAAEQAEP